MGHKRRLVPLNSRSILHATTEGELEGAFVSSVEMRAGGVVIAPDPLFANRIEQLVALQVRHAMPTIYNTREFAAAGGLMGYGSNVTDTYRLVGVYVGRIFRGESRPTCRCSRLQRSSCH